MSFRLKLDETQQDELKRMSLSGIIDREIAEHFGISVPTVQRYRNPSARDLSRKRKAHETREKTCFRCGLPIHGHPRCAKCTILIHNGGKLCDDHAAALDRN